MNKGTNTWHGSGNVASAVHYGRTRAGDEACNFKLVVERRHKALLYVRVNAYEGNVEVCRLCNLGVGDYVVVVGELMNREGNNETLTEVRANEIVITAGERRREHGG